jgi:hypothetical protein
VPAASEPHYAPLEKENTVQNTKTPIERFFETYAFHTDKGNVPELVASFAEVFLAAGPQGAQPVRASDFALALPKRYKLFESMGCRSTELTRLQETCLDERHVSARTRWSLTFERPGKEPEQIVVESTFLIDAGAEPFRIVLYLAHSDIMEILKHRGIAPA